MDLIDLTLQAVDGTKVGANATGDRTLDGEGLERLLRRVDQSLKELEAENETGEGAAPAHLPDELTEKTALREKVRRAMDELSERSELRQINLTDKDARLMRTRRGIAPCYNAQAMVSPTKTDTGGKGMLITAVEVADDPDDHSQLVPMLQRAEETTGLRSETTLADAGYHSGSNLQQCGLRDQQVVMPEAQRPGTGPPHITRTDSPTMRIPTATSVHRDNGYASPESSAPGGYRCGSTGPRGPSAEGVRSSGCVRGTADMGEGLR